MAPGPEKQFNPDDVLDEAIALFCAHGFEGTSLSQIMDCTGIGKKSLYDTFGNKKELFLKALGRYAALARQEVRSTIAAAPSPLEGVVQVLKEWEQQASEPKSHGCLIGTNAADFDIGDERVAEAICSALQGVEDAFFEGIESAREQREFSTDVDSRDLARMLVSLTQGVALLGRVSNCGERPQSSFKAAEAMLRQL